MIVDATRYLQQRGVFDIDLISDCKVMCMFTGEAEQTRKHSAPYLIDITLSPQAYGDDLSVPHFHRRYFEHMWEQNVGIFIQSSAPMEAIHRHFRKFLKFNIEGENNRFFRYWDPRVLKTHLVTLAQYHKASHHFFNLPANPRTNQQYPPVTFVYETHSHSVDEAQTDQDIVIATNVAHFDMDNYLEMQQRMAFDGKSANPVSDLPLMEIVDQSFSAHKRKEFCETTARWLIAHYGDKNFENKTVNEFLLQQLALLENKYLLILEYEMKYALAGCYLLETDLDKIDEQFLKPLSTFSCSPAQRAENFLQTILDSSMSASPQSKEKR